MRVLNLRLKLRNFVSFSMSAIKNSKRNFAYYEDEPPEKKIVSDGDILIKDLFEKQRNTKITLQEQLLFRKEFAKSTEFVPLTSYTQGTSNLQKFQSIISKSEDVEKYKAAGLTNEDIQLLFDSKNGEEYLYKKHKNCDKSGLKERLIELENKIKLFEEVASSEKCSNDVTDRHKSEFSLSIKPNSTETKLLKFALSSRKTNNDKLQHPMDAIKDIEKSFVEHNQTKLSLPVNKIRKKARNLAKKVENACSNVDCSSRFDKIEQNTVKRDTKWDSKEVCDEKPKPKVTERKEYTCKEQNLYTITNGEIVKIGKTDKIHLDANKKISISDIRQIPRFKDFEIGLPSKVLYIKNLHKDIESPHLEDYLKEFITGSSSIKVLTGKMKDQAFATFETEEAATKALEKLNGTLVKDKPIIVQYGRKNNKENT